MPEYIVIENLKIQNALPSFNFSDDRGSIQTYGSNASAIFAERGSHIIIRNCELTNCGNGFFSSNQTSDILIEYCYIHGNGIEGSIYEHNNYTETSGIVFQFNRFGSLRAGCPGNNLKDRSKGTVIRYNWIENGNRQLDLVDSGLSEFYSDELYRSTFVYGNILIEAEGEGNNQIIHYGGDSGNETRYRKGTLYLYNNTIISTRTGNTTLLRLSSNDESCLSANNVIYNTAGGSYMAILNAAGSIDLRNNWLPSGWVASHSGLTGTITASGNIEGSIPGFNNFATGDYSLSSSSFCVNSALSFSSFTSSGHYPVSEYVRHQNSRIRSNDGSPDIGAFEYPSTTGIYEYKSFETEHIMIYPNPMNRSCMIEMPEGYSAIITDIKGQVVKILRDKKSLWQPDDDVKSGVYSILASGKKGALTKKLVYIK
jgi:hypothetical protein